MARGKDVVEELNNKVFLYIANNDVDGLKTILSEKKIMPDIFDENGMTPLQHSAYKGNKEMVQLFLDLGADVNIGKHEHAYSALHFAALSGNAEVCHLLLSAGAKSNVANSVGRTASQMAAFVGNHACVATINNFIPRADIDYYTIPQGLEKEPKLPPYLAVPLHKFVMQVNVHPVRVALNLQRIPHLCDNLQKIQKVLELMSAKEMKRGLETNEVMSFKLHYLSFIVAEVAQCKKRQLAIQQDKKKDESTEGEEKRSDPTEAFIKKMLKSSRTDPTALPEFQESFLRESVREFPYRDCMIFRQMVSSLAQKDSPPALSVVMSAINGQRGFVDNTHNCCTCGEENATKKCSKCRVVQYCDRECQRLHWFVHKKACSRLTKEPLKAHHTATLTTNVPTTSSLTTNLETLKVQ